MSIAGRMRQRVSILVPNGSGDSNEYGDEDDSGAGAWDRADNVPCIWWQVSAVETSIDRDTQVTSYSIILPIGTSLDGGSRVELTDEDGNLHVCEVKGDILTARTGRGRHHLEAQLQEVTG